MPRLDETAGSRRASVPAKPAAMGRAVRLATASLIVALCCAAAAAGASEMVYRPVNPGFGGNPFNGDYLLGTATAQDDFEHERKDSRSSLSTQEQFVRTLQSRLLSALSGQVTEAIFGEQPLDEGTFRFDDQVVSFTRGLETIEVDILNEATGERTQIAVPTLRVED